MSEQNQKVLMPVEVFNALTNYVMSRPYNEVNQLVDELRQSVQVVETPSEEPAVEELSDE